MLTSVVDLKENAQREALEKKRAEREKQKEEKKKQQEGNVSANTGSKLNKPEEEEDIIGNLMKEIRQGKTLRRRSEAKSVSSRPNRSGAELKKDDILRLQKIYEQSVTETSKHEVTTPIHANHIDGEQAMSKQAVTAESQFLSVNQYKKDRSRSEAFAGNQHSRRDQVRHSFHCMPHYETTV